MAGNYVYDIPQPRKNFYEQQPRLVFSNWLYDQNLPALTRERLNSLLYDRLYGDYFRQTVQDPVNAEFWGDYLYGKSPSDMSNLLSEYSFQARGYDPRKYITRARWTGF